MQVAMIYGSWGRQVDSHILAGYIAALRDCSDYQVCRAADFLIRNADDLSHPPTAPQVRHRALKYERTAEADLSLLDSKRAAHEAAIQRAIENRNG